MKTYAKNINPTAEPVRSKTDMALFDDSLSSLILFLKQRRLTFVLILISPFFIYLVFALLNMGPSSISQIKYHIFNNSADTELIIWCLKWWPYSLSHHLNPFVTHYIWNSSGYNLAWATSVPTLGLVLAPLSLLFNPVLAYNIMAIIALPLSAVCCFYLVYYLTRRYFSSLCAGCIFGFSTYQFAQLVGHPSLYITFLVPILILLYVLRLDRRISRKMFIILSSLVIILQFGISNEVLASFMVFAVIALALFYLVADVQQKKLLISTLIELCVAGALALVILTPYFYYLLVGYDTVPKIINSPALFSSDILNFIIPTPVTWLLSSHFEATTAHFTANYSEDGAYLGIPLVAILIGYVFRYWRKVYVKVLGIMLIITFLASLGPKLLINGKATGIILPWAIARYVPVLRSALPDRFTVYISLIAAIIVGSWLAYSATRKLQIIKYLLVFAAIISLLPNSIYSWPAVVVPKVFQTQYVSKYIPRNSNVLILPFGYLGNSMYYQVTANMKFTQAGGYMGFTPIKYDSSSLIQEAFFGGVPETNFKTDLLSFCNENKVHQIVYTPDINPSLQKALQTLSWPQKHVGNSVIISVP